MIKAKQIITGIGILAVSICFTNALDLHTANIGETTTSYFDNGFKMQVGKNGRINTTYLGDSKNILAFNEYDYFLRNNNGLPFISDYYPGSVNGRYYNSNQGIINNYLRCDSFIGTEISNCQNKEYTGNNINEVSQVLNNINRYLYGNFVGSNAVGENYQAPIFCFSASDYNKSVCFYACSHPNCGSYSANSDTIGGIYPPRNLNLRVGNDYSFNDFPKNQIGNFTGYKPINSIITEQCPTIKSLMDNMGDKYNTGLCYNNTTYFNGTTFENVEKEDIFTIFDNNYENYNNRISIYRNNCNNPSTTQNCQNAFSGQYKKYSIISNAINSKVDEKKLRNYCNLGLNYPPNATTCTASGYVKEDYTTEEKLEQIISTFEGIPTPTEESNSVFNSLCDPDDEECFQKNIRDIFGSMESIYNKIIGLFKERNNVNGIIPEYILWITFLMILFTVIFKK